jgi:hypothetical protein
VDRLGVTLEREERIPRGWRLELVGIMRMPVTGSTVLPDLPVAGTPDRLVLPILDPGRAGTDLVRLEG